MLCTTFVVGNNPNVIVRTYIIPSQGVLSVVKSKARPVAVVRAGRGSRSADVITTQNLSTPGVKA